MKIIIQTIDFTAKQDLNNFVNDKVSKLSTFYDRIESAAVNLKLDKSDNIENKVCDIRLAVPGNDLFAGKQAKTFEEATALSVEALELQLKKLKSKLGSY